MEKINLYDEVAGIDNYWKPIVAGELNAQVVKLAKIKGEFIWHHHEAEDELFIVLKGKMTLKLRDRDVEMGEGDMVIVPRGVEHKPVAEEEVHILMFEPQTTINTGNVRNELTIENH